MEKKKIIFIMYSMTVGGVEKAFLNFLTVLPLDKLDITLFLMECKGDYVKELPNSIHVVESSLYKNNKWMINSSPKSVINQLLSKHNYTLCISYIWYQLYRKLTNDARPLYNWLMKKEKNILKKKYDLAIAYASPSYLIDFYTIYKIQARKKVAWIHYDVNKFGFNIRMNLPLYKQYDKIFTVSREAEKHFIQKMPFLSTRVSTFYNVLSSELVLKQAQEGETFKSQKGLIKILTVGRISKEKGQDLALRSLKILLDKGYKVHWYFVGDGPFKTECEALSAHLSITEYISFVGIKINPYGYMRDCDVYVQPSRHEGYCITLAEARVFSNPIVATDFVGAKEQLATRRNGIVTGFSETELAEGIVKALEMDKETSLPENSLHTDINKLLTLLD